MLNSQTLRGRRNAGYGVQVFIDLPRRVAFDVLRDVRRDCVDQREVRAGHARRPLIGRGIRKGDFRIDAYRSQEIAVWRRRVADIGIVVERSTVSNSQKLHAIDEKPLVIPLSLNVAQVHHNHSIDPDNHRTRRPRRHGHLGFDIVPAHRKTDIGSRRADERVLTRAVAVNPHRKIVPYRDHDLIVIASAGQIHKLEGARGQIQAIGEKRRTYNHRAEIRKCPDRTKGIWLYVKALRPRPHWACNEHRPVQIAGPFLQGVRVIVVGVAENERHKPEYTPGSGSPPRPRRAVSKYRNK